MNVQRTLDVGTCLDVLTNPQIFDDISEDGATFNDLKVDVIGDYWISMHDKQTLLGVAQFKPLSSCCYESHIHILGEHRKAHAESIGKELIKWCEQNLEGVLYVKPPSYFNRVTEYLKQFGFVELGTLEKAWRKNGVLNSMTILSRGLN
jgi:N-acetylglutamate synthase-like GNAT family acetyltransferase